MARHHERYSPDYEDHGIGDTARRNAEADYRDQFGKGRRTQNMPEGNARECIPCAMAGSRRKRAAGGCVRKKICNCFSYAKVFRGWSSRWRRIQLLVVIPAKAGLRLQDCKRERRRRRRARAPWTARVIQ